jgi:hypothetical protein
MSDTAGPISGRAAIPYFFFSYARADRDVYLERFFSDLRNKVASLLDASSDHVAFLDTSNVNTGADWNSKIAKAAQVSRVLVCVYSPRFFSKTRTHEYCAKEFFAFLKRQTSLRYERYIEGDASFFRVRDVRNVIPILWYSEEVLRKSGDLPPPVVRTIQYTLNEVASEVADAYKTKGMNTITIRRTRIYSDIIQALASLIRDYSNDPLPPLANVPDFAALRNAFWDPPEGTAENEAGTELGVSEITEISVPAELLPENRPKDFRGPGELLAIELRSPADRASVWMPYEGQPNFPSLLEDVAAERQLALRSKTLDPADSDFLAQTQEMLAAATATNTMAAVFLDPFCLRDKVVPDRLRALLVEGTWRGGLLLPVGSSDPEALSLAEQHRHLFDLPLDEQQRIVIRWAYGSATDFRVAVLGVLDDILARIIKHGEPHQRIPNNPGPETIPRITNVPVSRPQ